MKTLFPEDIKFEWWDETSSAYAPGHKIFYPLIIEDKSRLNGVFVVDQTNFYVLHVSSIKGYLTLTEEQCEFLLNIAYARCSQKYILTSSQPEHDDIVANGITKPKRT